MAENENKNIIEINMYQGVPVEALLLKLLGQEQENSATLKDIKDSIAGSSTLTSTDSISKLIEDHEKKQEKKLAGIKTAISKLEKENVVRNKETKDAITSLSEDFSKFKKDVTEILGVVAGALADIKKSNEEKPGQSTNQGTNTGVQIPYALPIVMMPTTLGMPKQFYPMFMPMPYMTPGMITNNFGQFVQYPGGPNPIPPNPNPIEIDPKQKQHTQDEINLKITYVLEHGDDSLKHDVESLKTRIKALEDKYGEDIGKILAKNNEQDAEIKALKEKLSELDKKYDDLKKRIEDLEAKKKEDDDKKKEDDDKETDDDDKKKKDDDKKKPKKNYVKVNFLNKSLKQTTILAEPKDPWYKRLGNFAINHPILTGLIGAGLGLGLAGAACGITAAAGLTSMLSYANFFFPTLAISTAAGAVAGGTLSGVSRLLPFGRREKLYNTFAKDKEKALAKFAAKEFFATKEEQHNVAKQEAREKQRSGNRLLKSLGVYKAAKAYHKMMAKASKKVKRYYGRKYINKVEKALKTKNKLNLAEVKKGKTMAIAGYLQKKRKLEAKFAAGKIDAEEFQEEMQDLDEDVADLKGGEPGLTGVGNQMTYDKEALTLVERVEKERRTDGMNAIVDNIKRRNSKVDVKVQEVIIENPEDVKKKIMELIADGKRAEADALQLKLDKQEKAYKEYVEWARAKGLPVEAPKALTEDEALDYESNNPNP